MNCECYFCSVGKEHPSTHTSFEVQSVLKKDKAESLDPTDRLYFDVCATCAHIRPELEK